MSKKTILIIIIAIIVVLAGVFLLSRKSASRNNYELGITNYENQNSKNTEPEKIKEEEKLPVSSISGIASKNGNRRPFAVMLAADGETRPLSGIGQADLVVEMPVIKGGINRFMAVYVTEDPAEIGSVRSARHDFIPLADGLNAILAHWGGSHFALDKLNAHVINNLDALGNPYSAFYRKKGILAPDNGFTDIAKMTNSAGKLGYELTNSQQVKNIVFDDDWNPEAGGWAYDGKDIAIKYPVDKIEWKFNNEDKLYYRWRGGKPEMDKNTGKQVTSRVIALISAASRHLEGQYNDVNIEGSGDLKIYQSGFMIEGRWSKDKSKQSSLMRFIDKNGYEIQLLAGQRWWEINDIF